MNVVDLPADLVGCVVDLMDHNEAIAFASASSELGEIVARTLVPWERGGVLADRRWDLCETSEREVLSAHHQFVSDAIIVDPCGEWEFVVKVTKSSASAALQLLPTTVSCVDVDVGYSVVDFELLRRLPRLRRLTLTRWNASDDLSFHELSKLSNLESLQVREANIASSATMIEVLTRLRRLTEVDLSYCSNLVADSLAFVTRCDTITSINVSHCNSLSDQCLHQLSSARQLTSLNLNWCALVTDEGVDSIARNLPNVTYLDIGFCAQLTDRALAAIALSLQKLRHLNIQELRGFTDHGVRIICSLERLEELDCRCTKGLTGSLLSDMTASLPNFKRLIIDKTQLCDGLLEEALLNHRSVQLPHTVMKIAASFAASASTIAFLDISGSTVTDDGLKLLSVCARLSDLNVAWTPITGTGFVHLRHLPAFRTLRLGGDVSVDGCIVISEFLNLTTIVASHSAFTDAHVEALAKLPHLTELDLNRCESLTERTVACLSAVSTLRRLNVMKCSGISDDAVTALLLTNPNLRIVTPSGYSAP